MAKAVATTQAYGCQKWMKTKSSFQYVFMLQTVLFYFWPSLGWKLEDETDYKEIPAFVSFGAEGSKLPLPTIADTNVHIVIAAHITTVFIDEASSQKKLFSGVPTNDTNRSTQKKKLDRGFNFGIEKQEELYNHGGEHAG